MKNGLQQLFGGTAPQQAGQGAMNPMVANGAGAAPPQPGMFQRLDKMLAHGDGAGHMKGAGMYDYPTGQLPEGFGQPRPGRGKKGGADTTPVAGSVPMENPGKPQVDAQGMTAKQGTQPSRYEGGMDRDVGMEMSRRHQQKQFDYLKQDTGGPSGSWLMAPGGPMGAAQDTPVSQLDESQRMEGDPEPWSPQRRPANYKEPTVKTFRGKRISDQGGIIHNVPDGGGYNAAPPQPEVPTGKGGMMGQMLRPDAPEYLASGQRNPFYSGGGYRRPIDRGQ